MAQPRQTALVLVLILCVTVAFSLFFGYRASRTARHVYWQNELIQPWMSVPFVAHTYHIRSELLFQAIGVPPNPRDHRPIRVIARAEKLPVAELIRDLRNAIAKANGTGPEAVPQSGKAP